jgi:hypothetical protein
MAARRFRDRSTMASPPSDKTASGFIVTQYDYLTAMPVSTFTVTRESTAFAFKLN